MKQGTVINKLVMLLFFLAILLYLGGAAWKGLRDPYPTVAAYAYEVDDTVEATGWLVRTEYALLGQAGKIVRLIPAEGERVSAGTTVALLYADEDALERSQRLETLQTEEAQLTAAIQAAGDSNSQGERSSQVVMRAMVELRSAVEAGDLTHLESQTSAFKSAVYQQAQRYGDADALSATLSATRAEIDALRAQAIESEGKVTADQSGIFSGQVDGYERILTPAVLEGITPADLDALALSDQEVAPPAEAVGKLITDSTWRFVCALTKEEAGRLSVGEKVAVRFSRDWSGQVDMKVERIGKLQEGRVAVTLASNRQLSDITLLRRQTVELVFAQQTGIRVPTQALRVETDTVTDKETGEEKTVQVTCVYVRVGVKAERKTVTVLAQGEDYTLVEPCLGEEATSSQQKKALRAGDEVVIARGPIRDGMVIE